MIVYDLLIVIIILHSIILLPLQVYKIVPVPTTTTYLHVKLHWSTSPRNMHKVLCFPTRMSRLPPASSVWITQASSQNIYTPRLTRTLLHLVNLYSGPATAN